jgi:protein SCO1
MAKTKYNKNYIIGLAVAILLPLSFYMVVDIMSKGKVKIPKYYRVAAVGTKVKNGVTVADTQYYKVNDLTLTNQVNELRSLNKDLKGKILVLDFFFADCTTSCPKLAQSMKRLQKGFRRDPKKERNLDDIVHFISITVLPERDSVPRLRTLADKYQSNPDHWWLMTGDKKAIYNYIRNELGLVAAQGDGGAEDLIHTETLVLIDQDRYIRGYYNGVNDTAVAQCADDIVLLTLEKKRR